MLDPLVEAEQLRTFASRVRRLLPLNNDPERFHIEKSELVHDLERAAREHETMARIDAAIGAGRRAGIARGTIRVRGREIAVETRGGGCERSRLRPGTRSL